MEQRLGLVCNRELLGRFMMSQQASSTFSTHVLKSDCRKLVKRTLFVK